MRLTKLTTDRLTSFFGDPDYISQAEKTMTTRVFKGIAKIGNFKHVVVTSFDLRDAVYSIEIVRCNLPLAELAF